LGCFYCNCMNCATAAAGDCVAGLKAQPVGLRFTNNHSSNQHALKSHSSFFFSQRLKHTGLQKILTYLTYLLQSCIFTRRGGRGLHEINWIPDVPDWFQRDWGIAAQLSFNHPQSRHRTPSRSEFPPKKSAAKNICRDLSSSVHKQWGEQEQ
jgi:hypothetical protein